MLIYLVNESGSSINNSFIANNKAAYKSHLQGDTLWEIVAVSPEKDLDILVEWRYADTFDKV